MCNITSAGSVPYSLCIILLRTKYEMCPRKIMILILYIYIGGDTNAQREDFKSRKVAFHGLQAIILLMWNIKREILQNEASWIHVVNTLKTTRLCWSMPRSLENILLGMTNMEKKLMFGNNWTQIDKTFGSLHQHPKQGANSLCQREQEKELSVLLLQPRQNIQQHLPHM